MSFSRQAFDWQLESNLPGFVVYYVYIAVYNSSQAKMLFKAF